MNTVAITNLNYYTFVKSLFIHKDCQVIYFKQTIPDCFLNYLKRKKTTLVLNLDIFPKYQLKLDRIVYDTCMIIANHTIIKNLIQRVSDAFGIDETHVGKAVKKHLIQVLEHDVCFYHLVKESVRDIEAIEFWFEFSNIMKEFVAEERNIKHGGRYAIHELGLSVYMTIWPTFIVVMCLFSLLKRKNHHSVTLLFQQKYGKRFGGNPEFDAFYRYLQTRDDVLYHCRRRNDQIFQSIKGDGKPTISNIDLYVSFSNAISYFKNLIIAILRNFKLICHLDSIVWFFILSMFKEYVITECLVRQFKPLYLLRIRTDMYANHPITTGICEKYGCKNIGYFHGPPVYFQSTRGIVDFHFVGVMGAHAMSHIYSDQIGDMNCYVMGPITAEIDYDLPFKKNGSKRAITFFATSPVYDPNDNVFREAFSYLVESVKDKNGCELTLRDKMYRPDRISFVNEMIRKYNIDCRFSFSNNGIGLENFSSRLLKHSDFVVICSISTAAWECLSLRTKFMVYLNDHLSHPIELDEPKLVAKNRQQFCASFSWLWNIGEFEYRNIVDPIVTKHSKAANGYMAKEFFEEYIGMN